MANYICQNRYGTFYFRFIIPRAYRKHFKNKREIRYSLKTDSKKLAVRRARLYRVRVDNLLEQLGSMAKDETITTELMHFFSMIDGSKITADGEGDEAKELRLFKAARRDDAELAKELGIDPTEQITKHHTTPTNDSTETWESFSSNYLAVTVAKRNKRAEGTVDGLRATYNLLPFILGNNRSLKSFTNEDMEVLYEGLRILPTHFKSPTSPYKDMSFQQLKMAAVPTTKLRKIRTINQDFGRIKTVFEKACENGDIDRNVAASVTCEVDQIPDKQRKLPYDDDDLHEIFTHPHFTENKWRKVAKTRTPEPYTFWLFPLALLTGARMNELLQLEKKNVIQSENGWYLDIKNEFDLKTGKKTKSVKNKNSIRRIPISDKLVEMGFLRFVASRRKSKLFSEVCSNKNKASKKLNYRLKIFLNSIDEPTEEKEQKSFHSLRHTFVTHAVNAGAKPQFVGAVTGHLDKEEFKGVAELANTYYNGHPVDMLKKEVIDKLDFDIDFSGIQWPK